MTHRRVADQPALLLFLMICISIAAVCAILVLPRGLDMEDESAYIYLLSQPDVVIQFLDHRLWATIGLWLDTPSVAFWRAAALSLSLGSALLVAFAYSKASEEPADSLVLLATAFGAFTLFAAIRPTLNYGVSAFIFGNVAAAALLMASAPHTRRHHAWLAFAGIALSLLFIARFPAAILGLLAAVGWLLLARRGIGDVSILLAGFLLGVGGLYLSGFDLPGMLRAAGLLALHYHGVGALLSDLMRIGVIVGLAGSAVLSIWVVERTLGTLWAGRFIFILGIAVWVGIAVMNADLFAGQLGDLDDPLARNTAQLKRHGYGFWLLILAMLGWLLLTPRREDRWFAALSRWRLLIFVAFAASFTFVGTNTGILQRSAMNGGMLLLLFALIMRALVTEERVGARVAAIILGMSVAGWTALIALNSIWMPYWVAGRLADQTEEIEADGPLRGHHVTPAIKEHGAAIRDALNEAGFDQEKDAVIHDYQWTGEALLAGAQLANWPFFPGRDYPDLPEAQRYACMGIVHEIDRVKPRRVFAINIDYHAPLRDCLREYGVNIGQPVIARSDGVFIAEVAFAH